MADIFQEIDEELRQDRATKLWNRYGNYVIAVAVLIVIAVGGYKYWNAQDLEARQTASAAYQAAVSQAADGDVDGAISALGALASDAGGGYAVLARLRQAALAASKGDIEGAVLAYGAVASDDDAADALRDLARVRSVALQIETTPAGELMATLDDLAVVGNPWRPMALELKGVLAIKGGDTAAARALFTQLSDDAGTPSGMRARATEILKALQ
ncbi:MAG: tetratricopeptide repeat protein [Proteobacteria bacterium]|nr:tetratricopeptide repeat protein [Pseudomonadota bacterium]